MNWFYSPDGSDRFEVSEEALLQLIRNGKVTSTMLVWREGMTDWMAAEKANPGWFALPPVEILPAVELPPPVELPLPVETPAPTPPVEASPWSHPTPEPQDSETPPPPPADVTPPPPVEIVVLPASSAGNYTPSLSHPAPPPPGYDPVTGATGPVWSGSIAPSNEARDSSAMTSVISGSIGVAGSVSGICCCFGPMVAVVAGVTAVVFGHMAFNKTRNHPEAERDKNLAVLGLVLGYLSLALSIGGLLVGLVFGGLSAALQGLHSP